MITKRIVLPFVVLTGLVFNAQAQDKEQGKWKLEFQAGVGSAMNEGSFVKTITPAISLNGIYQISNPFGVRLSVGGWEGKGYVIKTNSAYSYSFVRPTVDLLWSPFKKDRNFYFMAGAGVLVGLANGAKTVDIDQYDRSTFFANLWDAPHVFPVARVGAGYSYPVSKHISLGGEAVVGIQPDAVNSKSRNLPSFNLQVLAGIRYAFAPCEKKAKVEKPKAEPKPQVEKPKAQKKADVKAQEEAAAKAKAEAEAKAAAEAKAKAEAEAKAAAEAKAKAEAQARAAAEAKAKAEAEAKAAAARQALAAEAQALATSIYFESNSSALQDQYKPALEKIANFLNAHQDWKVRMAAYCDSRYGTPAYNQTMSERRAKSVTKALKANGVSEDQIEAAAEGGTDIFSQRLHTNSRNRVVVCEVVEK